MRKTAFLVAAAAGLVLAGCGSSPAATKHATTTSTTSPAPNVRSQLLTLSDLPAGWSVNKSANGGGSGPPGCLAHVDPLKMHPRAKAAISYQGSANGIPDLGEQIALLPNDAKSALATINREIESCGHLSFTSSGVTLSGTIARMSFPPLADQSHAYQLVMSGSSQGVQVTAAFDIVVIRKGSELAVLLYGNLGNPSVTTVEHYARRAAAKL